MKKSKLNIINFAILCLLLINIIIYPINQSLSQTHIYLYEKIHTSSPFQSKNHLVNKDLIDDLKNKAQEILTLKNKYEEINHIMNTIRNLAPVVEYEEEESYLQEAKARIKETIRKYILQVQDTIFLPRQQQKYLEKLQFDLNKNIVFIDKELCLPNWLERTKSIVPIEKLKFKNHLLYFKNSEANNRHYRAYAAHFKNKEEIFIKFNDPILGNIIIFDQKYLKTEEDIAGLNEAINIDCGYLSAKQRIDKYIGEIALIKKTEQREYKQDKKIDIIMENLHINRLKQNKTLNDHLRELIRKELIEGNKIEQIINRINQMYNLFGESFLCNRYVNNQALRVIKEIKIGNDIFRIVENKNQKYIVYKNKEKIMDCNYRIIDLIIEEDKIFAITENKFGNYAIYSENKILTKWSEEEIRSIIIKGDDVYCIMKVSEGIGEAIYKNKTRKTNYHDPSYEKIVSFEAQDEDVIYTLKNFFFDIKFTTIKNKDKGKTISCLKKNENDKQAIWDTHKKITDWHDRINNIFFNNEYYTFASDEKKFHIYRSYKVIAQFEGFQSTKKIEKHESSINITPINNENPKYIIVDGKRSGPYDQIPIIKIVDNKIYAVVIRNNKYAIYEHGKPIKKWHDNKIKPRSFRIVNNNIYYVLINNSSLAIYKNGKRITGEYGDLKAYDIQRDDQGNEIVVLLRSRKIYSVYINSKKIYKIPSLLVRADKDYMYFQNGEKIYLKLPSIENCWKHFFIKIKQEKSDDIIKKRIKKRWNKLLKINREYAYNVLKNIHNDNTKIIEYLTCEDIKTLKTKKYKESSKAIIYKQDQSISLSARIRKICKELMALQATEINFEHFIINTKNKTKEIIKITHNGQTEYPYEIIEEYEHESDEPYIKALWLEDIIRKNITGLFRDLKEKEREQKIRVKFDDKILKSKRTLIEEIKKGDKLILRLVQSTGNDRNKLEYKGILTGPIQKEYTELIPKEILDLIDIKKLIVEIPNQIDPQTLKEAMFIAIIKYISSLHSSEGLFLPFLPRNYYSSFYNRNSIENYILKDGQEINKNNFPDISKYKNDPLLTTKLLVTVKPRGKRSILEGRISIENGEEDLGNIHVNKKTIKKFARQAIDPKFIFKKNLDSGSQLLQNFLRWLYEETNIGFKYVKFLDLDAQGFCLMRANLLENKVERTMLIDPDKIKQYIHILKNPDKKNHLKLIYKRYGRSFFNFITHESGHGSEYDEELKIILNLEAQIENYKDNENYSTIKDLIQKIKPILINEGPMILDLNYLKSQVHIDCQNLQNYLEELEKLLNKINYKPNKKTYLGIGPAKFSHNSIHEQVHMLTLFKRLLASGKLKNILNILKMMQLQTAS